MREIIFDTETTGLSPDKGDRIVEIGCIEMVGMIETGRSFHCYFNPKRDMPAEAEKIHGLSAHFLSDKPLFAERAEELLAFLGEANLVAHNAPFDMKFLNAELKMAGLAQINMARMIDTADMARRKFPGAPASLDALCSRFGIDRSHRLKHGALLDAELLAQVYIELNGGRQIGLGLAGDTENSTEKDSPGQAVGNRHMAALHSKSQQYRDYPQRKFAPSSEEIAAHQQFISHMDKPLWSKA